MNSSVKNASYVPLQGALKQIQFWMESVRPPQVMLATQTMEEFERQKLPGHCKAARRKIQGSRVTVRGRRQIIGASNTLATWPKDGLVEGILPTLLFVISGAADIRIADFSVHCKAGDIIFIPARIPKLDGSRPHYENITPEAHCDLLMVRSDVTDSQTLFAHICQSIGGMHENQIPGASCWFKSTFLTQLFAGLGDNVLDGRSDKSTFHLLSAIILLMTQEIEQGKCYNSLEFPSESASLGSYDPIQKAMEYVQNHIDRPLTINQVAHWVGLSRAVFTRRFRHATGESFKEYLTRLRLEQAKILLCQTDLSIERVSEKVGFTSGQLRNVFHQACQITPSKFRHRQKNSHNSWK